MWRERRRRWICLFTSQNRRFKHGWQHPTSVPNLLYQPLHRIGRERRLKTGDCREKGQGTNKFVGVGREVVTKVNLRLRPLHPYKIDPCTPPLPRPLLTANAAHLTDITQPSDTPKMIAITTATRTTGHSPTHTLIFPNTPPLDLWRFNAELMMASLIFGDTTKGLVPHIDWARLRNNSREHL